MTLYRFIASEEQNQEFKYGQDIINGRLHLNPYEFLNIYNEEKFKYLYNFTDFSFISGIEFYKFDQILDQLYGQIIQAIAITDKLELWSVWLDDKDINSDIRKVKKDKFSKDDLEWVFNIENFENPRCIKIIK